FADGRVFTGEQAVTLGLVDRLGTEEDARRWAAELVGLDPEKTKCFTFEEKKPLVNRLTSNNSLISNRLTRAIDTVPGLSAGMDWLEFELSTSGLPLWLYRP
ncbi:S49 family peptidase, partial [Phormidesmis sp. 146-33]